MGAGGWRDGGGLPHAPRPVAREETLEGDKMDATGKTPRPWYTVVVLVAVVFGLLVCRGLIGAIAERWIWTH